MEIRRRQASDVSACVELMRRTHQANAYPSHWPTDPATFLAAGAELNAWVAVDNSSQVIGHIALHDAVGDPAFSLVHELTGASALDFAVVARLLVDPAQQGRGVGGALLATAVALSSESDRHPILDVVTSSQAAIDFYEAKQWERIGSVTIHSSDGHPDLQTWVYAAPDFWPAASPALRAVKAEANRLAEAFRSCTAADLGRLTRCEPWNVHLLGAHVVRGIERTTPMLERAGSAVADPNPLVYYQSPLRSDPTRDTKRNEGATATAARFTSGPDIAVAVEAAAAAIETAISSGGTNVPVTTHWGPVLVAEDYLVTRVVELAVHGIDIADALGQMPWLTPDAEHVVTDLIERLAGQPLAPLDRFPEELIRMATGRQQSGALPPGFPVIT